MMPKCNGGLDCSSTAVFLGPGEQPALCEEHLAPLISKVHEFIKQRRNPLEINPSANFEIENAEVEAILNDIGDRLAFGMPNGFGFNLLIFSFGEGGSMFYCSNAERPDMIAAMKEFIEKQEAKS